MTKRQLLLLIFALLALPVHFNACSRLERGSGGGTVVGTPNVELYFTPYMNEGIDEVVACVVQIDLFSKGDSLVHHHISLEPRNVRARPNGAAFGQIEIPDGVYDRAVIQLANSCSSSTALTFKKTSQNYSVDSDISLSFEGSISSDRGFARLSFDLQALINELKQVQQNNEVAAAAARAAGTFTYTLFTLNKWVGGGSNSNWNTNANWQLGQVPDSTHIAIFDGICGNCSAVISANAEIAGVRMNEGFQGMITQASGAELTVRSGGWIQTSGNFSGGNSAINLRNSSLILTGGTFLSTSSVLHFENTTHMNSILKTGGNFNHGGGAVFFEAIGGPIETTIDARSDLTFNDLRFSGGAFCCYAPIVYHIQGGARVTTLGTLTLGITEASGAIYVQDGSIYAEGGVILSGDRFTTGGQWGTGEIVFAGAQDQSYTVTGNDCLPRVKIQKSSGVVSPSVGTTRFCSRTFDVNQGSFVAPTGQMRIATNFNYQLGILDEAFHIESGTSFAANNGTIYLTGDGGAVDAPAGLVLNHVVLAGGFSASPTQVHWGLGASQSLNIAGNLEILLDDAGGTIFVDNGTLSVAGNLTIGRGVGGGSAGLSLYGTNDQVIGVDASSTIPEGILSVNKPSGSVNLGSNLFLNTPGQSLSLASGVINMQGFALVINGGLVNEGIINRGGGVLIYGSLSGAGVINP